MIKKIKGKYFVNSVREVKIIEKKLKIPLPIEIRDNSMLTREPICCICGGDERKDVAIVEIGDREGRICSSCIEEHMPELWPELKKRIYDRNLELGITEMAEEVKKNSPF